MASSSFRMYRLLARGTIVLDAAIGTRLIAAGLDLSKTLPAAWNIEHPERVLELHQRDIAAGADAIVSNTFLATRRALSPFGLGERAAEIVRAGVELARRAAGPGRLVFGSIGPGVDEWEYLETAGTLAVTDVDAVLVETHTSGQAVSALSALGGLSGLPTLATLCDADGPPRPLDVRSLVEGVFSADAVGVNCVFGPDRAIELLSSMAPIVRVPLIARPSGSLPGREPIGPEAFGAAVPALIGLGVRMIGGCCGTDERHVAAIRRAVDRFG